MISCTIKWWHLRWLWLIDSNSIFDKNYFYVVLKLTKTCCAGPKFSGYWTKFITIPADASIPRPHTGWRKSKIGYPCIGAIYAFAEPPSKGDESVINARINFAQSWWSLMKKRTYTPPRECATIIGFYPVKRTIFCKNSRRCCKILELTSWRQS